MVKKIVRGSIKIGGIEMNSNILLGIMIPFIGTTLGSAMVFFMKKEMNVRLQKMLLGFASGVMIAASVWSLLIPAIDMSEQAGGISWMPPAVGFLFGMGFLLVLDTLIPHLHFTEEKPEGVPSQLKKTTMLVLAVTLHNIPEGMAVDMESCAIAQVCYMCGVPFLSYRIISDTPGVKDHYKQYLNFWEEAPKRSFEMIKVLIKVLSEE